MCTQVGLKCELALCCSTAETILRSKPSTRIVGCLIFAGNGLRGLLHMAISHLTVTMLRCKKNVQGIKWFVFVCGIIDQLCCAIFIRRVILSSTNRKTAEWEVTRQVCTVALKFRVNTYFNERKKIKETQVSQNSTLTISIHFALFKFFIPIGLQGYRRFGSEWQPKRDRNERQS